jgi:hypothetical protein
VPILYLKAFDAHYSGTGAGLRTSPANPARLRAANIAPRATVFGANRANPIGEGMSS